MISDEYKQIRNDLALPLLARDFLCHAILLQAANDQIGAFYEIMRAAWSCDDHGRDDKAKECRNRALTLIEEIDPRNSEVELNLVKIDLLRRIGRFKEEVRFSKIPSFEKELQKVIKYQTELCLSRDNRAHTFAEADNNSQEQSQT